MPSTENEPKVKLCVFQDRQMKTHQYTVLIYGLYQLLLSFEIFY